MSATAQYASSSSLRGPDELFIPDNSSTSFYQQAAASSMASNFLCPVYSANDDLSASDDSATTFDSVAPSLYSPHSSATGVSPPPFEYAADTQCVAVKEEPLSETDVSTEDSYPSCSDAPADTTFPIIRVSPVKRAVHCQSSDSGEDADGEEDKACAPDQENSVPVFSAQNCQQSLQATRLPGYPVAPQSQACFPQEQYVTPRPILLQPQTSIPQVASSAADAQMFRVPPQGVQWSGFQFAHLPEAAATCDRCKVEMASPAYEAPSQSPELLQRRISAAERQKNRRRQKLFQQVAGSAPLPAGMDLPAILGGQIPPRIQKNPEKRHVYTEKELAKRRRKGLLDDSDSESEERRTVRLPRSTLLSISTPQMTHYVKFLRATMELTPSQQDELSKQKRQIKNRESASRFRAKKEMTMVEIREKMAALEREVAALRSENQRLRTTLQGISTVQPFPPGAVPTQQN